LEIRTVDVGVSLRYADYGGEGPPIVLLHGLGGLHLNWMRLAPDLTRYGRVLVPDLPGFGGTPPLPGKSSIAALEGAILRFLDAVAPGPITLAGNSLGGALAILTAAHQKARVQRLMLFAPAVPHAYFEPFDMRTFFTMGAAMLPFVGPSSVKARPNRLGPERLVKEMMNFMTHDRRRIPKEVLAAHVEEARARLEHPWVGSAFTDTLRSLSWLLLQRNDFARLVKSIEAPTLVFAGDKDRLVRARSVRHMCGHNPRFQFRTWEDVGHVAQLEVPERVLPEIERFFAANPLTDAAKAA
jgi:pimeloyl-ACP methyl ester carboxylesterase